MTSRGRRQVQPPAKVHEDGAIEAVEVAESGAGDRRPPMPPD